MIRRVSILNFGKRLGLIGVAMVVMFQANLNTTRAITQAECEKVMTKRECESLMIDPDWYDKSGNSLCGIIDSQPTAASNQDYRGNDILTSAQLEKLRKNQPIYEQAADEVDIPWQLLAVIHLRETGLERSNPSNGQGMFQFDDYRGGPYPAGAVSDEEFLRQATFTATFLKNDKAAANYETNRTLTKTSGPEVIKDTLLSYNGGRKTYAAQTAALGYDPVSQAYEGSPYVMNRADAKRDPDVADKNGTWGQVKGGRDRDGDPIIEYPANDDYGAYVVYASLGGTAGGACGGDGSTTISEGGLTLEQAKAFMMRYGENVNGFSAKQASALWSKCNGGGSNCVTFSYFFNHAFTDLPAGMADGNGESIVGTLRSKGADGGTTPKIFSTFSWSGGTYGHTGIVLGIHGDKIIVGHASCSSPGIGKGDGTYRGGGSGFVLTGTLNDNQAFWGRKPSGFAYPANVDTQAIQEFIEKGYVSKKTD